MSIYKDIILDHYRNPRHKNLPDNPKFTINVDNPLCGDVITLGLSIKNNQIKDIGFVGKGCAISIASASMLYDYALDKNISDLQKLDSSFMLNLLGIELTPNRLKCALLSLEALTKIICQIKI